MCRGLVNLVYNLSADQFVVRVSPSSGGDRRRGSDLDVYRMPSDWLINKNRY